MKAGWNQKLKENQQLLRTPGTGSGSSDPRRRRQGEGGQGPGGSCWLPGRWGGGRTGSLPTSSVLARVLSRNSVMPDPRALAQLLVWSLGGRWLPQHPDPSSAASQVWKREPSGDFPGQGGACCFLPAKKLLRKHRWKAHAYGLWRRLQPTFGLLCSGYWHGSSAA